MALALVGPQSLPELRSLAQKYFSDIISTPEAIQKSSQRELPVERSDDLIFPFIKTGMVIKSKPVKELRDVSLVFALPPVRNMYRANPSRLLGHLIGQKGKGSLFSFLQSTGWVTSINGGTRTSFDDFSLFEISASLTTSGLEHWEEIVTAIFSHLQVIQEASESELALVWEEIKLMSALGFMYEEKSSAYDMAPELAESMLTFEMQHILSAGSLLEDFPYSTFQQFLSRLVSPYNAIVMLRSPTFDWIPNDGGPLDSTIQSTSGESANNLERWYGVPYSETAMTTSQLKAWTPGPSATPVTHLPGANPFIPYELMDTHRKSSSLAERKLRSSPPSMIKTSSEAELERLAIWHSSDEAFGHPRSIINFLLDSPHCYGGDPVYGLVSSVFSQTFAEKFYPSAFAGLRYSAGVGNRGLQLSITGYSPKLCAFAEDVISQFSSEAFWADIPDNIYSNCKDNLVRAISGHLKERPDQLCDVYLRYLLQEGAWLPLDRLAAAQRITKESVRLAATRSLRRSSITTYAHGDLAPDALISLQDKVHGFLGREEPMEVLRELQDKNGYGVTTPVTRPRVLSEEHTRITLAGANDKDENNALVCHFQAAQRSPKTTALLLVIQKLLGEPLFNQLRTKKQLGYIVSLGLTNFGGGLKSMRGFMVRVVSNRFSPWNIEKELGEFLTEQREVLKTYTQTDIDIRVSALITSFQDPPTSFLDEADTFWDQIVEKSPFDWRDQVIEALRALTVEEVNEAAECWLFNRDTRRTVSCMSFGCNHLTSLVTPDVERPPENSSSFKLACASDRIITSLEELTSFRNSIPYAV
jgi:insulysin